MQNLSGAKSKITSFLEKASFDIIALQEAWFNNSILRQYVFIQLNCC